MPPVTRLDADGEMLTFCMVPALTAAVAAPVTPLEDALIVELPECTPFTRPVDDTVATPVLELVHVVVVAVTGFPAASAALYS